jgi:hypothetical protein
MKYLALGLVSLSLALAGAARAEDPVLTITGQVVVEETDAAGLVTVRIVTETDSYRVHQDSKASDVSTHQGKSIAAPDGQRRLQASANYLGSGAIPDYQLLGGNREVAFYRAGYAGEVRYMDGEVGRLLAGLDQRGLGDETVVVFTADHGEALGDSDFWFAHGEYLIESLVRVPLVIRVPGRRTSRRADIASLLDVVPTLAGLFDFPAPEGARGRDLLSDRADAEHSDVYMALPLHTTRPRFGLVADGHQYLLTLWGVQEQEQLFRLGQPEQDLAQIDRGRLREMGQRLATMRAGMADTRESQTQQLSPEARRRLKALGYVGP